MKVKDLIKKLKGYENYTMLVSSDEELNTLFKKWEVSEMKPNSLVIWGYSGSEVE